MNRLIDPLKQFKLLSSSQLSKGLAVKYDSRASLHFFLHYLCSMMIDCIRFSHNKFLFFSVYS